MAESISSNISSDDWQRLIAGYVLYDLSQEEAAMLEQWMAADPAIAQAVTLEIERMQQVLDLAYAPEAVAPPAHLRQAILTAHQNSLVTTDGQGTSHLSGAIAQPPTAQPPMDFQAHRARRWQWGLGAIAATLIAGLGLSNVMLWRSLQLARAQLEDATPTIARTVALNPTDSSPITATPSVVVQMDVTDLQATLGAENLPPLPEGQVYVLWTVLQPDAPFTTDDKGAILTQTFTVDEQGTATTEIVLPPVYQDLQWVKAIAITVEAAEAPQRHESSPLLIEML
ncbi:MAG: anti-sigma factor [Leptolyngbyaceae bacterium]|nr:anti-sigma factor [Leptolyngbyaceae bacterium]